MFVGLPPQRWEWELKAAVWSEAGSACPQGSLSKVPALIWRLEQVLSSSTQKRTLLFSQSGLAQSQTTLRKEFLGADLRWYKWKNTYALFNGAGAYLPHSHEQRNSFFSCLLRITEMPTRMSYELDKFLSLEVPSNNFSLRAQLERLRVWLETLNDIWIPVSMHSLKQLTQLPQRRRWLGARCSVREGCQIHETHTSAKQLSGGFVRKIYRG